MFPRFPLFSAFLQIVICKLFQFSVIAQLFCPQRLKGLKVRYDKKFLKFIQTEEFHLIFNFTLVKISQCIFQITFIWVLGYDLWWQYRFITPQQPKHSEDMGRVLLLTDWVTHNHTEESSTVWMGGEATHIKSYTQTQFSFIA